MAKIIHAGQPMSIDREEWVVLNGDRQNIRIRTQDEKNPVILFIHGGPGIPDRHSVMYYQSRLTDRYTMVLWDQRGSGKSWHQSVKKQDLRVEQYVQDARALAEHLCKEFGKEKIVIAGHSWGTVIGTQLAARYPEHIAAYIGQGQYVEGVRNEADSWQFCVDEARKRGDQKALSALEKNPPVNGNYPSQDAMMTQRDCLARYGGACWKHRSGGVVSSILVPLLREPGYRLRDLPGYAKGALYLTDVLWPDVVKADFFQSVKVLQCPVLLTTGRHDYNTPCTLARQWFDALDAPKKEFVWFEESAHSPLKEEPEKWGRTVLSFLNGLHLS